MVEQFLAKKTGMARREPFHRDVIGLFEQAEENKIRLLTTTTSITTAWYMLDKYGDLKTARRAIAGILEFTSVIPVSHRAVKLAVRSDFKDLEDAVQHFTALEAGSIDAIITRNISDFKHSLIQVCTAGDYFS